MIAAKELRIGNHFQTIGGEEELFNRFELQETEQGYQSPSDKIIDSVHILQNAYYFFALTGEELTIKE